VTVNLGASYATPGGSTVSSVTLGPTSGAILRTAAGAAPPPPPPPTPSLAAQLSGTSVQLSWHGLGSGGSVDVYRNGSRKAGVSNTGSYADPLTRNAKGVYSYTVCVARTSTCTPTVSVDVTRSTAASVKLRLAHRAARTVRATLRRHVRRHRHAILR
jgi:hypothetical protein